MVGARDIGRNSDERPASLLKLIVVIAFAFFPREEGTVRKDADVLVLLARQLSQ